MPPVFRNGMMIKSANEEISRQMMMVISSTALLMLYESECADGQKKVIFRPECIVDTVKSFSQIDHDK